VETLNTLIVRAKGGDLEAFGRVVRATQRMTYAVARGLERLAMLRYGIDDIRKIEVADVA
jgi:phenylalanyl-tRNA synthetase alpha subunit